MLLENFINKQYCYLNFEDISQQYRNGYPFPSIFFKSFFNEKIINKVSMDFPDLSKSFTYKRNDINEKKYGLSEIDKFPESIKNFVEFLNSSLFLKYLNAITGIKETLIPDPYFFGGGLHQILNGGYLKVHSDFYFHPKMKLDRRLNLLIYLNKDWKEEYGGAIELWDKDMKFCQKKLYPFLNNVCIFSTNDKSFHGHPDPIRCPENISRKSIALYYYSVGRPDFEVVHSTKNTTNWKNRSDKNEVLNSYGIKDYLRKFKFLRFIKSKFF